MESTITITNKSSEALTKKQIYDLTKSPSAVSVKDVEDHDRLAVSEWVEFTDEKDNGKSAQMLAILGADGNGEITIWATQSATFKREFFDILNIADGDEVTIEKLSGVTKSDKPFVTCAWV